MAIFQIVNGKCHWRTPFTSLDEVKDRFPPDCLFVDAPDYVNEQWGYDETEIGDDRFIKPVPPEGWIYDDETGQMMPEDMLEQALEETKASKQNQNNEIFARWLEEHPMTWSVDSKTYGVTMQDQQEISLNLVSYQLAVTAAVETYKAQHPDATEEEIAAAEAQAKSTATLEWHAIHEACVPFTETQLTALSLAIRQYIYPGYTLNQQYKVQIYACESRKEVEAIELDYSSLTPNEQSEETTEDPTVEAGTEETTETPTEEIQA